MTIRYTISANNPKNPEALQVILSFVLAYAHVPYYQKFQVDDTGLDGVNEIEVQINMIGYESGTPGMYCIGGNLRIASKQNMGRVKGFYDCTTKTGWIEVIQ